MRTTGIEKTGRGERVGERGKPRALAVNHWLEPQGRGGASVSLFL